MGRAEGVVARHLEERCDELGIIWEKITCEGCNGCPDYLLTFPNGRMKRVETKSDNGKCKPHQQAYHRKLSRNRSFVFVPSTPEDVDAQLAACCSADGC